MDLDPPTLHKNTLTCTVPLIAEQPPGIEQKAARGLLIWDADDPLTLTLHFEVMMNSFQVRPDSLPFEPEEGTYIMCANCSAEIPYGEMGAVVDVSSDMQELVCLECADNHVSTVYEESLWVIGRNEIEAVLRGDDPPTAAAATVRMWQSSVDSFQIALRENDNLMILTASLEIIPPMLHAIRAYEQTHGNLEEDYLCGGIAELEKMLSKEK